MIKFGLRTKIAFNLVIFLVVGMVLLAFVMMASAHWLLVRAETARGNLLISAMRIMIDQGTMREDLDISGHRDKFDRLLEASGHACSIIMEIGLFSYTRRSFPSGLSSFAGYINML